MDNNQRPALRPLRIEPTGHRGGGPARVPSVPERVSRGPLAPNWSSPTENNGIAVPRAELHIALVVPSLTAAQQLGDIRVLNPPYWNGNVNLHVIVRPTGMTDTELLIRQAVADLGWADAKDLQIGDAATITLGYPSGDRT